MRGLVGNMAVSCMRNASGHNYRNSSFIVDVDMGQYHVLQKTFLVIFKFNCKSDFTSLDNKFCIL